MTRHPADDAARSELGAAAPAARLEAIRERHKKYDNEAICQYCAETWPCTVAWLLARLAPATPSGAATAGHPVADTATREERAHCAISLDSDGNSHCATHDQWVGHCLRDKDAAIDRLVASALLYFNEIVRLNGAPASARGSASDAPEGPATAPGAGEPDA